MTENKSLEDNLKDIEKIVERMELGDTDLEASIKLYKEGIQLIDNCNKKMDKIEKELIVIREKE